LRSKGFEEGKRRLTEVLLERSLQGKDFAICRNLLLEPLPQFVKDNIVTLAKKKLKAEKPVLWNFQAGVDFDDNEVKAAGEKLLQALLKNVRLEKQDLEHCINNAVRIQFDLLMAPIQTVEKIFFRDAERYEKPLFIRSVEKTSRIVPFVANLIREVSCSDFPYIDRINYKVIAKKVKDFLYNNHNYEEVVKEFRLLQELLTIDKMDAVNDVETFYLEEFLLSRGLQDAVNIVRKKNLEGKSCWQLEDFEGIFILLLKEPPANGKETQKIPFESVFPKIIYNDEPAFTIQRTKIERQPPGPYPSIFECIDSKDYKNFVRKIFQRSEGEFTSFLNRVDNVHKWREAKQIIDWELEKRHLDPYSKEAVRLGDIIFAKFFSNGKYS
jgi:hypothetical protein